MTINRSDRRTRETPSGEPEIRRTVIPTPRSNAMFAGWGVRF